MIFVFDGIENIMGKGENARYQHFLLLPHIFFKKASYTALLRVSIVW